MATRYAVYYAPPQGGFLEKFGRNWLGRNAYTGEAVPQIRISDLSADRLRVLTRSPRRYGFHGTLKAPFRLADGHLPEDLFDAVERFALTRSSFALPPLKPVLLDGFIALVPEKPCAALDRLAADAVRIYPFEDIVESFSSR